MSVWLFNTNLFRLNHLDLPDGENTLLSFFSAVTRLPSGFAEVILSFTFSFVGKDKNADSQNVFSKSPLSRGSRLHFQASAGCKKPPTYLIAEIGVQ